MNYGEFQMECATAGFTQTPLSVVQWFSAHKQLGCDSAVYGVACDVAAGFSFPDAVTAAIRAYLNEVTS